MGTRTFAVLQTLLALLCAVCVDAHAAPQTGWWWNPDESGRGFFVESHDGITFIGAYLYDNDGHALWLVAGGENDDAYNYTGPLYMQSGGETLLGDYVAPAAPVAVGNITVHFADDTHGTVTWPGGVVQIQRQTFGAGDTPFEPQAGWWWNADEPGTGYSLEVQGQYLFVVGFMYEDGGRPVWYFVAGPKTSDTTFHGDVQQLAGGQTIGGAYHPPGAPTNIATLDIVFNDVDDATFTFTKSTANGVQVKQTRSRAQHRQFVQLPRSYTGRVTGFSLITSSGTARWDINVDSVNLIENTAPNLVPLHPGKRYDLLPTEMHMTYTSSIAGCTGSAALNPLLETSDMNLTVFSDGTYAFDFIIPPAVLDGTITCPGGDPFSVSYPFPGFTVTSFGNQRVPNVDLADHHVSWQISSKYSTTSGAVQTGGTWDFKPVWRAPGHQ
jgi:hypothetical protein